MIKRLNDDKAFKILLSVISENRFTFERKKS